MRAWRRIVLSNKCNKIWIAHGKNIFRYTHNTFYSQTKVTVYYENFTYLVADFRIFTNAGVALLELIFSEREDYVFNNFTSVCIRV